MEGDDIFFRKRKIKRIYHPISGEIPEEVKIKNNVREELKLNYTSPGSELSRNHSTTLHCASLHYTSQLTYTKVKYV